MAASKVRIDKNAVKYLFINENFDYFKSCQRIIVLNLTNLTRLNSKNLNSTSNCLITIQIHQYFGSLDSIFLY